jgi:hypothetical protein
MMIQPLLLKFARIVAKTFRRIGTLARIVERKFKGCMMCFHHKIPHALIQSRPVSDSMNHDEVPVISTQISVRAVSSCNSIIPGALIAAQHLRNIPVFSVGSYSNQVF